MAAFLFRVHEAALGRPTLRLAREICLTQWLARPKIRELQFRKLHRLLQHARQHCPYYAGRPAYRERVESLADLSRLPIITRSELCQHACEMRFRGMIGKQMLYWTRGSSDAPAPFYWDRRRQSWDKANRLRGFHWQGLGLGHRELHIWPIDPGNSLASQLKEKARGWRDAALNECQLNALDLAPDDIARGWRAWHRFDPAVVTAYPSVLCEFIRSCPEHCLVRPNASLRRIHTTGELLFDWQRHLLEHSLGVPVFESYGVQEVGALAFECEMGSWHTSDESAIIEIVDTSGKPVEPGQTGRVVATALESLAMPLIRYATGDIARVSDAPCRCGRGLSVLEPVLGRESDFVVDARDARIGPRQLIASMADSLEDGGAQVDQRADGMVVVSLLRDIGSEREAVLHRLRAILGDRPVDVRIIPRLERTPFGKLRYARSALAAGPLVG